jgi:hypothetical protein
LIDNVDSIVDSAGSDDANKRKLYDRNEEQQWYSVGETAGTRTITWTPASPKTVDRILLQNINWKDFTIKYNTSNNFTPTIAVTGNSDTNIYLEVASQAVTNIVFSITDTITASEEAKAGQIILGEEYFEIGANEGGNLNLAQPDVKQSIIPLSDGTFNKIYVRKIINWALELICVPSANRQNYIDLYEKNRQEPFVFIPYPKTQSDVWDGIGNHYHWTNPADFYNYTESIIDNGFNVNIEMSQAGGI